MKIKWAYLKKPSVIIGAVVLFFVLLFLLNRSGGASATGSSQTVNAGPTDAQVQSQTQLALASISAGLQGQAIQVDYAKSQDSNATQLALAEVAAAMNTQGLSVQQEIADRTISAQTHGMDLQYQGLVDQNATALAAAQAQYTYGLDSQAITANTQIQLGAQSLQAFETSTAAELASQKMSTDASVVMSLTGHNKYASVALPAYFGTAPETAPNGSHGLSPINIISPITNLF